MNIQDSYPNKIICLTEECTETIYLLGEEKELLEYQTML